MADSYKTHKCHVCGQDPGWPYHMRVDDNGVDLMYMCPGDCYKVYLTQRALEHPTRLIWPRNTSSA